MRIKLITCLLCLLTLITVVTTTIAVLNGKRLKEQKAMIVHQREVIDSLLCRRMTVFDVALSVSDNSKLTVYGKKSQNLQVPATKTYMLKLDSVSVKQLAK